MRKASNLSEVARLAGVSPITASRAIRGTGYVSEAARTRIMAAAAQLNYTPDMLARRQAFAARHSWARRAADINEAIAGR